MGYLMARYKGLEKLVRNELLAAFAFLAFIGFIYAEYVANYSLLNGLFMTCFGLIFFYSLSYKIGEKANSSNKVLAFLGQEAFPIYLTHFFFLPYLPWLNKFLATYITNRGQVIVWELWIGALAIVLVLVPTLLVIRLIKTNPYLALLFYGERIK